VLRVQGHVEIAAALVLRRKLAAPVAQQRVRVFEAGPLAREHQEELVVEVGSNRAVSAARDGS
jgi:hypothetical protein